LNSKTRILSLKENVIAIRQQAEKQSHKIERLLRLRHLADPRNDTRELIKLKKLIELIKLKYVNLLRRMSIIKQIAIILVLSILAGVFRFLLMDDDFSLIKKPRAPLKNFEQTVDPNEETISDSLLTPAIIELDLAMRFFEEKSAIFLDSRSKSEFQSGHIPNAIHIDFEMIEDFADLVDSLDRKKLYITYCGGRNCELSTDLGEYLFYELAFQKILIFHEGLEAWNYAGLPIE